MSKINDIRVDDTMQRSRRMRKSSRVVSVVLVFLSVFVLSANAQTSFDSLRNKSEQEHYADLDKWMLRAYEGDRDAQFKVGVLFASDEFDKPYLEQAVYWYRQAARQGHILAQYNLGHHLLTGRGVQKNELEAIQWWKEAAKEDHALAQFNVGRAYYLGIGVAEDHPQSRYWFSRAAQNNEAKSIEVLEKLGWERVLSAVSQSANNQDNSFIESQANIDTPTTPILQSRVIPRSNNETTRGTINGSIDVNQASVTDNRVADSAIDNDNASNQRSGSTSLRAIPIVSQVENTPVALYTNPSIRSVLISIIDIRDSLEVVESNDDWVTVRSTEGFPVWVHSDYLNIESGQATVNGNNVNARSVPITSKGTIVGSLSSGQELVVIDKKNDWYRLTSPSSFKAWVKTEDFNRPAAVQEAPVYEARNEERSETQATTQVPIQSTIQETIQTTTLDTEATTEANSVSQQDQEKKYTDSDPVPNQNVTAITNLVNDNNWLFGQAKDDYTLQLASFDDQEKVDVFLTTNAFTDDADLHRFTSNSKDITWTYFLYGSYNSREDAENIKTEIKQKRAWIRSFGRLQENRCLSWKTTLPTPRELNQYCVE